MECAHVCLGIFECTSSVKEGITKVEEVGGYEIIENVQYTGRLK